MSEQRVKWVIGNWKMHGRLAENAVLLQAVADGATVPPKSLAATARSASEERTEVADATGAGVANTQVQCASCHASAITSAATTSVPSQ